MAASGADQTQLLAGVTDTEGQSLEWYQGRLDIGRHNIIDAAVRLIHSDDLTTASNGSSVGSGLVTMQTFLWLRDKVTHPTAATDVTVKGWHDRWPMMET